MKTEIQKHLFASDTDGHLYDTRRHEWHKMPPLRTCYRHTFARIKTGAQLRATLRAGEFTFPGFYPLYLITSDGGALSFDTVRANLRSVLDSIRTRCDDGWRVVACEVNYEDSELYDDHTGEKIPSAYGED
jgi:hypothetical protein